MEHRRWRGRCHDELTTIMHWASAACVVELPETVLCEMYSIVDALHPMEGGASLYGHYSEDGHVAVVEGIAPRPRDARRGRFHFQRGVMGLAAFFRTLFSRTRGESYYVGEFHSHPGGSAVPSDIDDSTQFAIAADNACQCRAPVLIIIGGEPRRREVGVFVHTRARERHVLTSSTPVAQAQAHE